MREVISNDYKDLPSDPDIAFLVFENRISNNLLRRGIEETNLDNRIKYVTEIDQFIDVFNVKVNQYIDFTKNTRILIAEEHFPTFFAAVQQNISRIKMNLARSDSLGVFTSVEIKESSKEEIRVLVQQVKSKLDGMSFDEAKKDNLFRKLNVFLDELDRERTALAALTAAQIQIASATGEAAEKLEPLIGLFERIIKAVGRGSKEQTQLPKWDEPKQIEGPKSETDTASDDLEQEGNE